MAKQTTQQIDGRNLGQLVAQAVAGNGYCPTLSHPELQAMADAYDAACETLGLKNRAWRGGLAAVRQ